VNVQVLPQGAEEKDAVLRDKCKSASQDIEPDVADVNAVNLDLPRLQLDNTVKYGIQQEQKNDQGRCSPEESL
jgi:hypothetical protein